MCITASIVCCNRNRALSQSPHPTVAPASFARVWRQPAGPLTVDKRRRRYLIVGWNLLDRERTGIDGGLHVLAFPCFHFLLCCVQTSIRVNELTSLRSLQAASIFPRTRGDVKFDNWKDLRRLPLFTTRACAPTNSIALFTSLSFSAISLRAPIC